MGVLLLILGLLLILFGGGCTLILGGIWLSDPSSITSSDVADVLPIWLFLGLLPLAGGVLMFRVGLKLDRERRKANTPKEPN
jgi:hypothetical protein